VFAEEIFVFIRQCNRFGVGQVSLKLVLANVQEEFIEPYRGIMCVIF